jgi:DNA-binding beta-propeller fold protein YncE
MTRTKWAHRLFVALSLACLPASAHAAGLQRTDILYADWSNAQILAVDPATGDRSVLSSASVGSGPDFTAPSGVTIDPAESILYVTDATADAVFAVDPASGNRSIVSSNGVGAGPELGNPGNIVFDAEDGSLIVADGGVFAGGATNPPYLLRIDPVSGAREILTSNTVGSGPALSFFDGLALEQGGTVLLGQGNTEAVLRVDPLTHDRTTVSQFSVAGTGPEIDELKGLALGSEGELFALDRGAAEAVLAIDPASGDRTLISTSGLGTGPDLGNPLACAYDPFGQRLLVADNAQISGAALLAVDPVTGDRTVLSGTGVGVGPALGTSFGIVVVPEPASDLLALASAAAIAVMRGRGLRRLGRRGVASPGSLVA